MDSMIKVMYYLLLLIVICVNFRIRKDFFHPIILSGSFWFLLPLVYEFLCLTNDRYWQLSNKFYFAICLYLIPFVVLSILIIGNPTCNKKVSLIRKTIKNNKKNYINNILNFCLFCNFLLIIRIFLLCHSFNILNVISVFRVITTSKRYLMTPDVLFLLYTFSMTPPLCCYVFLNAIKLNKYKIIIFFIEFIIITILYLSKGRIMKHFIMIVSLLLLNNKLNLKTSIISFLLVFVLIFGMTIVRDNSFMKNFSFIDYIFVYLLSPLPAFDMLINNLIPYETEPFGGRVLGFFYRVFVRLFGGTAPTYSKMFITIPAKVGRVPTNVYTCFGNSYMDFGFIGIFIFGLFTALVFSSTYRLSFYSNKLEMKIFYILIVYCLLFQFFGDFFFQFLSIPLQDLLCAILVVRTIRTRIIK